MSEPTYGWYQDDDDGAYETACDGRFQINEGTPEDNGMVYYPFCGRKLIELPPCAAESP